MESEETNRCYYNHNTQNKFTDNWDPNKSEVQNICSIQALRYCQCFHHQPRRFGEKSACKTNGPHTESHWHQQSFDSFDGEDLPCSSTKCKCCAHSRTMNKAANRHWCIQCRRGYRVNRFSAGRSSSMAESTSVSLVMFGLT